MIWRMKTLWIFWKLTSWSEVTFFWSLTFVWSLTFEFAWSLIFLIFELLKVDLLDLWSFQKLICWSLICDLDLTFDLIFDLNLISILTNCRHFVEILTENCQRIIMLPKNSHFFTSDATKLCCRKNSQYFHFHCNIIMLLEKFLIFSRPMQHNYVAEKFSIFSHPMQHSYVADFLKCFRV